MSERAKKMLAQMGLNAAWFDCGWVDEEFISHAFESASRPFDEHCRIPFYRRFLSKQQPGGITDGELARFVGVVALEPCRPLQRWALGWLIEDGSLTNTQLASLKGHPLTEAHRGMDLLLRRTLARKNAD